MIRNLMILAVVSTTVTCAQADDPAGPAFGDPPIPYATDSDPAMQYQPTPAYEEWSPEAAPAESYGEYPLQPSYGETPVYDQPSTATGPYHYQAMSGGPTAGCACGATGQAPVGAAGYGYGYAGYGGVSVYTGAVAGGLHGRHPYYSYRRPWFTPGPVGLNVTIVW